MAKEYWTESLREVFDEHGLDIEVSDSLVRDVMFVAEMESESTGRIYIPNPAKTELDEYKLKYKRLQDEHDRRIRNAEEHLQSQLAPNSLLRVYITDRGEVAYYREGC